MKPLVIYHANCADGFGAAFAAWSKFRDEAEYVPMQYGKAPEDTDWPEWLYRDIYILDFSFPKEIMDWLFTYAKRVVWLDHHKASFEMWCGPQYLSSITTSFKDRLEDKKHIVLDINKSGAMLAWEHFHPEIEIPLLIQHIDDYDRWQFKLEGTKELNKALWSYAPWSFDDWYSRFLGLNISGTRYTMLLAEGEAILRAHEANVQAIINGVSRNCCLYSPPDTAFNANPPSGLAANCPPHLASDVGHQLANQSGTYGLLWHINKEGKCICSLRSNGDYDVAAIAKAFGGGGHKNAAGFEIDIQTLLGWIR